MNKACEIAFVLFFVYTAAPSPKPPVNGTMKPVSVIPAANTVETFVEKMNEATFRVEIGESTITYTN